MAINSAHLLSLYLQVLPPQKVENPGKSQTKGAVRGAEEPLSQPDLLSKLKKAICISILSRLYVEVTPDAPSSPREKAWVSETLQPGVNGARGQGLA